MQRTDDLLVTGGAVKAYAPALLMGTSLLEGLEGLAGGGAASSLHPQRWKCRSIRSRGCSQYD